MDTATRWKNEALNNASQFLKMQLFRAALPANLRKVVAQRNPNTLTLDEMYQIAMDTEGIRPQDQKDDRGSLFGRKGKQ